MAAGSRYGITLKQLRDLMEFRGKEGVDKINNMYGGVHEIAKKLQSSETTGKKHGNRFLSVLQETGLFIRMQLVVWNS